MKLNRNVFSAAAFMALLVSSVQVSADPHSDGLSLGKSNLNKLSSKVNNQNAQGMPHYTNNPSQSQNFGSSSLFNVGATRITTCKTAVAGSDKVANQECDAVNFLAKNPEDRVKFPVSPNDPIIKGVGDTINNATGGSLTEACTTKTTTTPDIYATEVCNEFYLAEPKSCAMGQVVEVSGNANFLCNVTKNSVEYPSCDNALIVQCSTPVDGCDNGGIIPGSTQGDMYTTWGPAGGGNYALQFGVIGDNYWKGSNDIGVKYTRTLQFSISDLSTVTQFMLANVWYDDYLNVQVNGVTVFNGPKGGSYLNLVDKTCGNGKNGFYPCNRVDVGNGQGPINQPELGESWSAAPSIDLRPFLTNGNNVITTTTIVGGEGESAIQILGRMMCPGSCTYTWDNQCVGLDART
ncbi:hypothetical protein ACTXN4_13660 [Pseudomonas helleri]|uniref:hypothetical protein n=1 Tax=Pseudomonas helleri TaxID=1608996 RepID=UPI003FD5962C